VAGLIKFGATGGIKPGSVVVCTLTGHGLKDPDTAMKNLNNTIVVEPDIDRILKILEV
jgi:threonine synthase